MKDFLDKLERLSPDKLHLVEAIRSLFMSVSSDLEESIKYGGIVYSREGSLLGGIFTYTHHVSVEFSNGAQLSDPKGVLEGKGTYRRHIKLTKMSDLDDKKLSHYVTEALTME
ncbi:MAG: DUF1801 domain-containing protein [Balneolaceae bacterium]